MAINSLSPGFVKLYYSVANVTHTQVLPTKPSGTLTPGAMPDLLTYGSSTVTFDTALTAYVTIIKTAFGTANSFIFAEFWSQPLPTDDPLFIYQKTLGIVGTSGTSPSQFGQHSLSFRTQFGGLYRNVLLESIFPVNIRDDYPFANAMCTSLTTYLTGASSWVYGRDGGKLVAGIRSISKTNDQLRKRYLLNS